MIPGWRQAADGNWVRVRGTEAAVFLVEHHTADGCAIRYMATVGSNFIGGPQGRPMVFDHALSALREAEREAAAMDRPQSATIQ